jgi:hypothetical protein
MCIRDRTSPEDPGISVAENAQFMSGPPGIYLKRAESDPDFGVIISEEDFTDFLNANGIENSMKGISVSVLALGTKVITSSNIISYNGQKNESIPMEKTMEADMESLGFTVNSLQILPSFRELKCSLGDSKVTAFQIPDNENATSWKLSILVDVVEGEMNLTIRQSVLSLLDLLGGFESFWDDARSSTFSITGEMIRVSDDFDPDSVDWSGLMSEELKSLVESGIISGLDEEGIEKISSKMKTGAFGFKYRLFYDF